MFYTSLIFYVFFFWNKKYKASNIHTVYNSHTVNRGLSVDHVETFYRKTLDISLMNLRYFMYFWN